MDASLERIRQLLMQVRPASSPEAKSLGPSQVPDQTPSGASSADAFLQLVDRARRGDRTVATELARQLDAHPALWQAQGDVARALEQLLIDRIAGPDMLVGQSVRRKVEALKTDLLGGDGNQVSALERLLCDRVTAAWLISHFAELSETTGDASGSAAAKYRLARAESASRRFVSAATALAKVRRLASGLHIRIERVDAPAGATAKPASSAPGGPASESLSDEAAEIAVRDRIRDYFARDASTVAGGVR